LSEKSTVNEDVLDELEEILITSDVGVDTTVKIIKRIEDRVAKDKYLNTSELNQILRDEIAGLLSENNTQDLQSFELPKVKGPYVMLVVGGQTGSLGKNNKPIGKARSATKRNGEKVWSLGAADTF